MTAYGVIEGITVPKTIEAYKPKERLEAEDTYKSKPEIAAQMIRDLQAMGFQFKLVLANSLYGESGSNFVDVLYQLNLNFVVAYATQSRGVVTCWTKGSVQQMA